MWLVGGTVLAGVYAVAWGIRSLVLKRRKATAASAVPLIEEEGVLTTQLGVSMTASEFFSRDDLVCLADVRVTSRALYVMPESDVMVIVPLGPTPLDPKLSSYAPETRLLGEPKINERSVRFKLRIGLSVVTLDLIPNDLERFIGALKLAAGKEI